MGASGDASVACAAFCSTMHPVHPPTHHSPIFPWGKVCIPSISVPKHPTKFEAFLESQPSFPSLLPPVSRLVHQVRDELGGSSAHRLVVALEGALELQDQSREQQLSNLRELGVHDSHQRTIHGREAGGRGLALHQRTTQHAPAPNQVLARGRGQQQGRTEQWSEETN